MKSKLKVGDLIYLKDVGFPYNGEGSDGYESMEGASAIVKELNAGYNGKYISVEFIIPIKNRQRSQPFTSCLFHPESCVKENRPWLKKNLKQIIAVKNELRKTQEKIVDILNEM